jgi:hypothetical protein
MDPHQVLWDAIQETERNTWGGSETQHCVIIRIAEYASVPADREGRIINVHSFSSVAYVWVRGAKTTAGRS